MTEARVRVVKGFQTIGETTVTHITARRTAQIQNALEGNTLVIEHEEGREGNVNLALQKGAFKSISLACVPQGINDVMEHDGTVIEVYHKAEVRRIHPRTFNLTSM